METTKIQEPKINVIIKKQNLKGTNWHSQKTSPICSDLNYSDSNILLQIQETKDSNFKITIITSLYL